MGRRFSDGRTCMRGSLVQHEAGENKTREQTTNQPDGLSYRSSQLPWVHVTVSGRRAKLFVDHDLELAIPASLLMVENGLKDRSPTRVKTGKILYE